MKTIGCTCDSLRTFWPSRAKRRHKAADKLGQRFGDPHDLHVLNWWSRGKALRWEAAS